MEAAEWKDEAPNQPLPFWSSLRADLNAHVPTEQRDRRGLARAAQTAATLLRSPGFHATLTYRVAHTSRARLGGVGRLISGALFWSSRHWYGCSIASTARLYGGLILPHPQGIVIGAGAVVGPRSWLFQNVTIGGAPGKSGLPRVGSDARIYSGAVLAGRIQIGDNVTVGANAVVVKNIPSHSLVRSPAAEIVNVNDHVTNRV